MENQQNQKLVIYLGYWMEKTLEHELESRFQWLIRHLTNPQESGDQRPVCPWTNPAIKKQRFYIGDARHCKLTLGGIKEVIEDMAREYQRYTPFDKFDKSPPSLTVLLPDSLDSNILSQTVDLCRPELIPIGLMLAALDPLNNLKSLKGANGFPYRSPWKFLTVRWMVPEDSIFLNLNPNYLSIYQCLFEN